MWMSAPAPGLETMLLYMTVVLKHLLNLLGSQSQTSYEKVQVGIDQEKAQSEKDSHSKNRGGKKNKLTIRYLYHENIS